MKSQNYKIGLSFLVVMLSTSSLCFAQHNTYVNLTNYAPSPNGKYESITMNPIDVQTTPCLIGSFYVDKDNANIVQYCKDGISWTPVPSIWVRNGSDIIPEDSSFLNTMKVGIGKIDSDPFPDPQQTLHVMDDATMRLENDEIQIEFDDTNNDSFRIRASSNHGFRFQHFDSSWQDIMAVKSWGWINIGGTFYPDFPLHVYGDKAILEDTSTDLLMTSTNGAQTSKWNTTIYNDVLRILFFNEGTGMWDPRFSIKETHRNLGIGTEDPQGCLDINGWNKELGPVIIEKSSDNSGKFKLKPTNGADFMFMSEVDKFIIAHEDQPDDSGSWVRSINILSNGNVGLGTETPQSIFHIQGEEVRSIDIATPASNVEDSELWLSNPNVDYKIDVSSTNLKFNHDNGTNSLRMVIDEDGRMAIGNLDHASPTPNADFEIIQNLSQTELALIEEGPTTSFWQLRAHNSANPYGFSIYGGVGASLAERLVITPDGLVGIGFNNPSARLHVNGNIYSTNDVCANDGMGSICLLMLFPPSDENLKKDIEPIEDALSTLLKLKGVSFDWRNPKEIHQKDHTQMGMLAQDVEEILPQWVHEIDKDGNKMIHYQGYEGLLVEAIRELKSNVDDLKTQNANLKKRIQKIQNNL